MGGILKFQCRVHKSLHSSSPILPKDAFFFLLKTELDLEFLEFFGAPSFCTITLNQISLNDIDNWTLLILLGGH